MRASTGTAVSIGRAVASPGAIYRGSSHWLGWFDRHFAMATVSPAIIVSLLVFGLPLAFSLWISFQGWSIQQSLLGGRFVALQNYADLFADPAFVASIWRTFIYTGVTVAAELGFGLAIAMLLNLDLPFIGIFRTALIVPMMMTPIVAALCWKMLLDPQYGIIDYLIGSPIVWLGHPRLAFMSVALVNIWQNAPYVSILLLAGLRSLPQQPFEAAALDGVPRLFVFYRITLPMLSPYIITASLFRVLDAIQQFDIIYAMTQGGPGNTLLVFQVRAYLEFYQYTNVGKSAALLVVLWAITYVLSNVFIKNWLRLRERSRATA